MKMPIGRRFPLVAAAAIGAGALLAFALPAQAGVNLQSESPAKGVVKLGATARLDANGAVVFAPVTITCAGVREAYLTVSVTEAVGAGIASGTRNQEVTLCDGRPQKINVAVTPTQRPFRVGVAFGQASLQVCGSTGCTTVLDEHNIRIVK